MAQWQTDEAERNFADMISAAERKGPQVVMRNKDPVAVVLSPDDYLLLVRQADANFAHLLALSPFDPEDIEPVGMSHSSGERTGRENSSGFKSKEKPSGPVTYKLEKGADVWPRLK